MKKYSLKQDITPFLLILQQLFVTKVVEKTFLVEGVIEIIFIGKFSQNFPRHEDDSSSTASLVCTVCSGFIHIQLVWAIALSGTKAMREAPSIG